MGKYKSYLIVILLFATVVPTIFTPAVSAIRYTYGPPYDYASTDAHGPGPPSVAWAGAYADPSSGKIQMMAFNFLLLGDIGDIAWAYAQVFDEWSQTCTVHTDTIQYSYEAYGALSSVLVPCMVKLDIFVQRWTGWWIFWWWEDVAQHTIFNYISSNLVVSESGSGSFSFQPPATGTYRVAARIEGAAPPGALGGVYFMTPSQYAKVSISVYHP